VNNGQYSVVADTVRADAVLLMPCRHRDAYRLCYEVVSVLYEERIAERLLYSFLEKEVR